MDETASKHESKPERIAQTWYEKAVLLLDSKELDEAMRAVDLALQWKADFPEATELRDKIRSARG